MFFSTWESTRNLRIVLESKKLESNKSLLTYLKIEGPSTVIEGFIDSITIVGFSLQHFSYLLTVNYTSIISI